jgi:hypothetical protein
MVALIAESPLGRSADPCPVPRGEALLVEQLGRATRELRIREAEGSRSDVVRAVIRSLRNTLSWVAEHGNVFDPDHCDFVVKRAAGGEIELWNRARKVPICPQPLGEAFRTAGVEPEPGQIILAHPELVRWTVDESLVSYSLQELRLRQIKAALLRTTEDLKGHAVPVGR